MKNSCNQSQYVHTFFCGVYSEYGWFLTISKAEVISEELFRKSVTVNFMVNGNSAHWERLKCFKFNGLIAFGHMVLVILIVLWSRDTILSVT